MEVVLSPKKVRKVGKNGRSITNDITNSLANITNSLTDSITYVPANPSRSSNIPSNIPGNSSIQVGDRTSLSQVYSDIQLFRGSSIFPGPRAPWAPPIWGGEDTAARGSSRGVGPPMAPLT